MTVSRSMASLCLALAAVCAASHASRAAEEAATDPVYVYYPRGDCRGDGLDLELWDREGSRWVSHPVHPWVPLESCQLEDAGYLFNEIRTRCVEPPESEPAPAWIVGLDVFAPEVMETCAPDQLAMPMGDLQLHVVAPEPGGRVSAPRMEVAIEGSVRMDGVDGTDYDVLLVIDRSSATRESDVDLLAAQLAAARAWIERLAPRLGALRIGIAAYPNMPPLPGSAHGTGVRRVVPLTDDAWALYEGLQDVLARGASGFQTFGSAFDFAVAELEGRNQRSGARPGARKVLVMAANGVEGTVLDPDTEDARQTFERRLGEARARHLALHLFALGGLSEKLSEPTEGLFERSEVQFQRVLRPDLATGFLSVVSLPQVAHVVVANRTAGGGERAADVTPSGRFATTVAAAAGTNRLWARATLSDGATTEREWDFVFDDVMVKRLVLEAEREHMRRVREENRKKLELDAQWSQPLPAGGEASPSRAPEAPRVPEAPRAPGPPGSP